MTPNVRIILPSDHHTNVPGAVDEPLSPKSYLKGSSMLKRFRKAALGTSDITKTMLRQFLKNQ